MSPKAGLTHDVTIKTVGGTALGFMYARDTRGLRGYKIFDARTLQPRVLTMGEITEAEFPPEFAGYWSQDNWELGIGGIHYKKHEGYIASGKKIDTTARGILAPAREVKATTVDTNPGSYKPSGFAVVGTEVHSFQGPDVYSWNYTNKDWDIGTEPLDAAVIYRNGVVYGSRTYAPSWYTADDSPSNYIYKADADADWTRIADSPGDADGSITQFKYLVKSRDAQGDEILWGMHIANIVDSEADLAEALDDSETDWDVDDGTKFSAGDIILIDDELMTVSSINVNTVTGTRASLGTTAAAHDNGKDISIRTYDGKHQIKSTSDPTDDANWSSAINIGQSDSEIVGGVADGQTLLIAKTNGLYAYYASGIVKNLTPSFTAQAHPDNFRAAHVWNGHILLPLGAGGMYDFYAGALWDVSLKQYAPELTELHGRVVAITSNPDGIFILVHESASTKYHLLMGQWLSVNGVQDWHWHNMGEVSYTSSTVEEHCTLFAEGIPSGSIIHNRIWVGVESGGSNLFPYFLPQANDAEDGYANSDIEAVTVEFDAGLAYIDKRFASLDMRFNNVDGTGGRQFVIEYQIGGIGAFSHLETVTSGAAVTKNFPGGTGSTSTIIALKFKPTMTSVGTTRPELTYFRLTYQLRTDAVKTLPMALYLADNQELLNGGAGGRPKLDLAQLETWNAQAEEVVVEDARVTSRNMVFVPGSLKVYEVGFEQWRRPEYMVAFLLAEV